MTEWVDQSDVSLAYYRLTYVVTDLELAEIFSRSNYDELPYVDCKTLAAAIEAARKRNAYQIIDLDTGTTMTASGCRMVN